MEGIPDEFGQKRRERRNAWFAERLGIGHEGNVTVALRPVRESKALICRLGKLERNSAKGGIHEFRGRLRLKEKEIFYVKIEEN